MTPQSARRCTALMPSGPAGLSFVAGMFFVVRPGHPWWTATPHNLAVFGTYLLGALTIVVISSAVHRARQRAIDRQIELEREAGVRVQAEEALRKAHDELELRSEEHTSELQSLRHLV